MREIKFRAWDKKDKIMILPNDKVWKHELSFEGEFNFGKCVVHNDKTIIKNEEVVLMQYTGLKDKNGKEIYEGDILNKGYGFKPLVIKDIRLDTTKIARMIQFKQENKDAIDVKVIGNIYENPELIKKH